MAPSPARRGRVYPRVYGGTAVVAVAVAAASVASGLSPRVRGNHDRTRDAIIERGSIPACTGEPVFLFNTLRLKKVYPRVYGGTLGFN